MSTEKDGSGIYNMNKDNWGAEIEFRSLAGGCLITNAPENRPWNENSKGLLFNRGNLVYRNGREYQRIQAKDSVLLNDGKWHTVSLSSEGGRVNIYVDGAYVNQIENSGSSTIEGHVLRIGQATKRFLLGASDLPIPFRGESFNGEIWKVRFFKDALSQEDIAVLNRREIISKESLVLDWKIDTIQKPENIKKGPIRIQTDLSKIRYANIWLQPLQE